MLWLKLIHVSERGLVLLAAVGLVTNTRGAFKWITKRVSYAEYDNRVAIALMWRRDDAQRFLLDAYGQFAGIVLVISMGVKSNEPSLIQTMWIWNTLRFIDLLARIQMEQYILILSFITFITHLARLDANKLSPRYHWELGGDWHWLHTPLRLPKPLTTSFLTDGGLQNWYKNVIV